MAIAGGAVLALVTAVGATTAANAFGGEVGSGADSSTVEAGTPEVDEPGPPGAPQDVRIVRAANGGVERVEWDRPEGGVGWIRYEVILDYTEAPLLGGPVTLECRTMPNVLFCDDMGPLDPQSMVPPPPGATLHLWVVAQDSTFRRSAPSEKITFSF